MIDGKSICLRPILYLLLLSSLLYAEPDTTSRDTSSPPPVPAYGSITVKTDNDSSVDVWINWELILRRWMGGLIKEMRKITFGPEPVVAYLLSVIEEVFNIRMIYTGINLGLDPAEIRKKLNLGYCAGA